MNGSPFRINICCPSIWFIILIFIPELLLMLYFSTNQSNATLKALRFFLPVFHQLVFLRRIQLKTEDVRFVCQTLFQGFFICIKIWTDIWYCSFEYVFPIYKLRRNKACSWNSSQHLTSFIAFDRWMNEWTNSFIFFSAAEN